jgi:hypothetical protein
MPTIEVTQSTFEKLKALAEPLVDTAETVVARLVDTAKLQREGNGEERFPGLTPPGVHQLNPDKPGNLAFTRVTGAKLGARAMHRPNWNRILRETHLMAIGSLGSIDAVRKISGAHLRADRYEGEGFTYVSEGDFSIQGVDSNLAWENSLRIAKHLRIPLEIDLRWYERDGAAHPGERGNLRWHPNGA